MLLIIPAIELVEGKCAVKIKSDDGTSFFYERLTRRPEELCMLWRRENAKTLHITDLDSNYRKDYNNFDAIIFLSEAIEIPFQALARFQSVKECEYLLDSGVYRIAFAELLIADPRGIKYLVEKYGPSRIVLFVSANNRMANFSSFRNYCSDIELVKEAAALGVKRIIYGDEGWEKSGSGVNIETIKDVYEKTKVKITVFGGVPNSEKLIELNDAAKYGVDSVVIGKALYDNVFSCQKIWRKAESALDA